MNRFLGQIAWGLSLGLALAQPAEAKKRTRAPTVSIPWKKVDRQLRKQGLSRSFVAALKRHYRKDQMEKVLTLNVLSFLGTPNHHDLVTPEAVEKTARFIREQREHLEQAEKSFGVSGPVIAALLWVETRHGSLTGNYHVPSVYLSLYLAREGASRSLLLKAALRHPGRALASSAEIEEKIKSRTERKSEWALGQLKILDQIHRKSARMVKNLKGSFAGAFGIPQFIPESYSRWAISRQKARTPDLYRVDDAVFSVANYLIKNGWKEEPAAQKKALMHYNNSEDYALAILDLARQAHSSTALLDQSKSTPSEPSLDASSEST